MTFVKTLVTAVAIILSFVMGAAAQAAGKASPKAFIPLPTEINHNVILAKAPAASVRIDLEDDWPRFNELLKREKAAKKGFLKMLVNSNESVDVYASAEEMCVWADRGSTRYMAFNVTYSFLNKKKELVMVKIDMTEQFGRRLAEELKWSAYPSCKFEHNERGGYDMVSVYYTILN